MSRRSSLAETATLPTSTFRRAVFSRWCSSAKHVQCPFEEIILAEVAGLQRYGNSGLSTRDQSRHAGRELRSDLKGIVAQRGCYGARCFTAGRDNPARSEGDRFPRKIGKNGVKQRGQPVASVGCLSSRDDRRVARGIDERR